MGGAPRDLFSQEWWDLFIPFPEEDELEYMWCCVCVCVCVGAESSGDTEAARSHSSRARLPGGGVQGMPATIYSHVILSIVTSFPIRNCLILCSPLRICRKEQNGRTDITMCCPVSYHDNLTNTMTGHYYDFFSSAPKTRVHLPLLPGQPNSDYINANYIRVCLECDMALRGCMCVCACVRACVAL